MNQIIVILSCSLFVGLVVGAPVDDGKQIDLTQKLLFTSEDCGKPIEDNSISKCRALIPRVTWSDEKQDCVDEFYGGCHATANNFVTKEECLQVAKTICQTTKH